MSLRSKFKSSLLLGTSMLVLAAAPSLAQEVAQAETEAVIVTGTRVTGLTAADSSAPITGVVNIILKKNSSGGVAYATGGQYFDEGGSTYDFSGNIGFPLGNKGFLNVTGEKRYRGFSQRGGQDIRQIDAFGVPRALAYNP